MKRYITLGALGVFFLSFYPVLASTTNVSTFNGVLLSSLSGAAELVLLGFIGIIFIVTFIIYFCVKYFEKSRNEKALNIKDQPNSALENTTSYILLTVLYVLLGIIACGLFFSYGH